MGSGTLCHDVDADARAELEAEIAARREAGDLAAAATAAIRGYGPEILGYLVAATGREHEAADVFSVFCEDLWRGLPGFSNASTVRTWAYQLARRALYRRMRVRARRERIAKMVELPDVEELAEQIRTATLPYLRTQAKVEIVRLREQLDPDERSLLILRVDRRLSWNAIARITSEDDDPTEADIERNAARLRKRFERIKERLRTLARPMLERD